LRYKEDRNGSRLCISFSVKSVSLAELNAIRVDAFICQFSR